MKASQLPHCGNILVEALLVIPVFGLALVANLELARRSMVETRLHHAAFLEVRAKLFGGAGGRSTAPRAQLNTTVFSDHLCTRSYTKFRLWQAFYLDGVKRMNFEVARKCRFYFSR